MSDHNEHIAHGGRVISGGMAAAALATVIQLLQLQTLSWQLVVALYCFALALPILVFAFTRYTISPSPKHVASRPLRYLVLASGLVTLVGLAFVFFHLNITAGIIFAVALGIAVVSEIVW